MRSRSPRGRPVGAHRNHIPNLEPPLMKMTAGANMVGANKSSPCCQRRGMVKRWLFTRTATLCSVSRRAAVVVWTRGEIASHRNNSSSSSSSNSSNRSRSKSSSSSSSNRSGSKSSSRSSRSNSSNSSNNSSSRNSTSRSTISSTITSSSSGNNNRSKTELTPPP